MATVATVVTAIAAAHEGPDLPTVRLLLLLTLAGLTASPILDQLLKFKVFLMDFVFSDIFINFKQLKDVINLIYSPIVITLGL
jgi:hypothetical protein